MTYLRLCITNYYFFLFNTSFSFFIINCKFSFTVYLLKSSFEYTKFIHFFTWAFEKRNCSAKFSCLLLSKIQLKLPFFCSLVSEQVYIQKVVDKS